MDLPKLKRVGDADNSTPVQPPRKKKKILLLSDDLRMSSGVATVSRELVTGTVEHFDWVQVGAALKHPEAGKWFDLSPSIRQETGVYDANVKVLANNGYGDPNLIRNLIVTEKPDAILHFTDPRQWEWLYDMENEIRQVIPIMYLNIWDNLPDPYYNKEAYASCDALFSISKQTYGINKRILDRFDPDGKHLLKYVPHGINPDTFQPITKEHPDYEEYQQYYRENFSDKGIEFVVFWNNRNIRRKNPGDIVLAYRKFVDTLPEEDRAKVAMVMHTAPIDQHGTDLHAVVKEHCPDYKIIFSLNTIPARVMNFLYNSADVTVNIASAEGFGLATAESVMSGTPIIVGVTGGLQDQCGFYFENKHGDKKYIPAEDYEWIRTLHHEGDNAKLAIEHNLGALRHGEWAFPIWPKARNMVGSPPTPYIFDDYIPAEDLAFQLKTVYNLPKETRTEYGLKGRDYFLREDTMLNSKAMCNALVDGMRECIVTFQPREKFIVTAV